MLDNSGVVVNIGVLEEGPSNGVGVEDGSDNFSSARESEEINPASASHSGRFSRLHSLKSREEKVLPTSLHPTPSQN